MQQNEQTFSDFGWKIPSKKNVIEHNARIGDSQSCVGDNDEFSMLEDADEENDYIVDAESSADDVFQEPKLSYDVETLSAKDTCDTINQHNELYPEGHEPGRECSMKSASIGVHQHASKLEKEIKEKEKEIKKLQFCSIDQELKEKHVKMGNDYSELVAACEKMEERNAELTKQMLCYR